MKNSFNVKTIVVGDLSVGKTSMIHQLCTKQFRNQVNSTVAASFTYKIIDVDSYTIRFQIWDTAGSERFRTLLPMYYRKTNLAIVVYDITNMETFNNVLKWIEDLEKNADNNCACICIIGNKCDLEAERVVSYHKAAQFAKSIGALHFETSAKTSEGVMDAFMYVARQMANLYHQRGSFDGNSSKHLVQMKEKVTDSKKASSCC